MFRAIIFCFLAFTSNSQSQLSDKIGCNLSIFTSLGTHTNGFGLRFNAFYKDYFYQINASTSIRIFENNIGKRKKYISSRSSIGALILGGKKEQSISPFFDGLNHQTTFNNGIGFNYLLYLDNKGTSQKSGGFALHFSNLSIYHENDVFGGEARDRFRTGNLHVSYRRENFKLDANLLIWTGETRGQNWQKIDGHLHPNGFKIIEDLPYGHTSHGIISVGATYAFGFGQTVNSKIGIDGENIRHAFQNKLMHDMVFLPKKINRTTPHYPRLDENGCPVFEKEYARKDLIFFQVGTGNNWSY